MAVFLEWLGGSVLMALGLQFGAAVILYVVCQSLRWHYILGFIVVSRIRVGLNLGLVKVSFF